MSSASLARRVDFRRRWRGNRAGTPRVLPCTTMTMTTVATIATALTLLAACDDSTARAERALRRGTGVLDSAALAAAYAHAGELPKLRSLLVERQGKLVGEQYWRGATRTKPANIKSA